MLKQLWFFSEVLYWKFTGYNSASARNLTIHKFSHFISFLRFIILVELQIYLNQKSREYILTLKKKLFLFLWRFTMHFFHILFLSIPGVLWQQRDKVFSRWKERYFVLTSDYLQCFKKSSPSVMHSAASEMGRFIFKLKLTEVSTQEIQQCAHLKSFKIVFDRD